MSPNDENWTPSAPGSAVGFLEKGIDFLYNQFNKDSEKQWWYEQQKFLEEHNSPAYQSMLRRKAGLNPYTDVGSVPLGNVNSSLPNSPLAHVDQSALSQSLAINSVIEKNNAEARKANVESGLIEEKTKTESEWRSNIIQQTLNLEQEYQLGLITKEERETKLNEFKKALEAGYNSYLIEQDLADSQKALNSSIASLNEAKTEGERQDTLNAVVQHAALTLELELDRYFEPLMREAEHQHLSINNTFDQAQFDEWLDLQDTRKSLYNVQIAFAKLASDEATRQDALNKIQNENDQIIAQQLLDYAKEGKSLKYFFLNLMSKDPGSALSSLTNIFTAFAPNYNVNRSSSTVRRVSQN